MDNINSKAMKSINIPDQIKFVIIQKIDLHK